MNLFLKKTKNNEDLPLFLKYLQISKIQHYIKQHKYNEKINTFLYTMVLREYYQKYEKEVLYEIKKVLLNEKTTDQILQEGNINLDHVEKYVYQYLH